MTKIEFHENGRNQSFFLFVGKYLTLQSEISFITQALFLENTQVVL